MAPRGRGSGKRAPGAGRVPLMAGNWKMNLDHLQGAHLVQKLDWTLKDGKHDHAAVEVAVLPPFTALRTVQTLVEGDRLELRYGAQDLSAHTDGAFSGEISGVMLARLGCTYVLAGHSERRQQHSEDDDIVNAKVRAAYQHGLTPIVCVGEGLDVRRRGEQVAYTLAQVDGALVGVTAEQAATLVIAYEPVWAIGSGRSASPEQAQEAIAFVRALVGDRSEAAAQAVRVLYGGSVKGENADELLSLPDVDGALVGGASLDPSSLAAIAAAASARA